MNWLDILLLVLLAIATIIGIATGIIKAILSIVGIVVGVILAVRFYVPLAERLTFISSETGAKIAAFAIILIGVLIIARLIAWALGKAASALMMGWINRLAGGVLFLALAALVISVLLALWVRFFGTSDVINNSRIAKGLLDFFPLIMSIIPADKIPQF